MTILNAKRTHVIETNVFVERFLTYREVFVEYFKTMNLIDRGETLTYETYSRLADNYIYNVKRFIKLGNSYVGKYHLEKTKLRSDLDNYFIELITALKCLNYDENSFDKQTSVKALKDIKESEYRFMETIKGYVS